MLQVLLDLASIPEGATVVKKGGTYEHTVKDKIVIYAEDPELTQTIKPAAGHRFIVGDESHSINMVEASKYFVWHTCLEELNDVFQDRVEGMC